MSELALPASVANEHAHGARALSDELLARLVGRGSSRAFSLLYERHHQALYRYCRSILRDQHDAQDALQSTMTQAYAALSAKEREVSLRAWLFRIAHNESITILRKHGRELDLDLSSVQAQSEGDPYALLESRGRLRQLVCDLHELPERQRSALVMRELSGLRIEEMAVALAISPAAAKQALFEARSSLHEFAEGREMDCEEVCAALSAHDGRVLRGRRIRAHLRNCQSCRSFQLAIGTREADLRALAPVLPASAAATILARMLGSGHWGGAGATAAGGSSTSLLAHAGGSLLLKGAAGVAIVAVTAVGTVRLRTASAPRVRAPAAALGVSGGASARQGIGSVARAQPATGARNGAGVAGGRSGRGLTGSRAAAAPLPGAPLRSHQPGEPGARGQQTAGAESHRSGEKPAHGNSQQSARGHSHRRVLPAKVRHAPAHRRRSVPAAHHPAAKVAPAAKRDKPSRPAQGQARTSQPSLQTGATAGQASGVASSAPAGESSTRRPGQK